jgi:hypothetical protein
MKPDFNAEEKVSIEKDTREIREIIAEMAECLPQEDPDKGEIFQESTRTRFALSAGNARENPLNASTFLRNVTTIASEIQLAFENKSLSVQGAKLLPNFAPCVSCLPCRKTVPII